MGSMSASDAAPLPRLGEVYFDVRGESRSMRLSWYADTGVAVFSIWQGGTCTGTFRLPIADLPRMIEALQRGPHGEAPSLAEQPDSQAPGYGTGPSSRSGPGDYDTGDYGAAGHGPGPGEYGRAGAHGRYEETRAIHPDDSLPGGDPGGYRGERGSRYEDEPTGVYHGDLLDEDYRDEPGMGYREDPLAGGYRDQDRDGELTSRYGDGPLGSGRRDAPRRGRKDPDSELTSRYGDGPLDSGRRPAQHGGAYPDSPPVGDYPGGPLTAAYPEDRGTGAYPEDRGTGAYPEDRGTGAYPEDRGTGAYPEDRDNYPREPMTDRYPADPLTGDYPTGPPADSAIDSDDYPPSSGNAGYSPARPYVAPLPGGAGGAAEGRRRRRARPASREESDPSPDSFPYGRPPAEPEVRGRGR
jgi:hypothetical protein